MRTSQPSAMFIPAPTAAPFTAASVGSGLRAIRRKPSYTLPRLAPSASRRLPRLAPAQNAGGVPVTTIAPTDSSASNASIAATISVTIDAVSVLRSSGLFSVSVPTPSSTLVSTSGMRGSASPPATSSLERRMLDHVFTDAISALRDAFEAAFLERQAFEEHFQVDVLLGDITWETSYGLPGEGQPPRVVAHVTFDWPSWSQTAYRRWYVDEELESPPAIEMEIVLRIQRLAEQPRPEEVYATLPDASPLIGDGRLERAGLTIEIAHPDPAEDLADGRSGRARVRRRDHVRGALRARRGDARRRHQLAPRRALRRPRRMGGGRRWCASATCASRSCPPTTAPSSEHANRLTRCGAATPGATRADRMTRCPPTPTRPRRSCSMCASASPHSR